MTLRDDLVSGLTALRFRLEGDALMEGTPTNEVLASGYLIGYLNDVIPRLEALDSPDVLDEPLTKIIEVVERRKSDA